MEVSEVWKYKTLPILEARLPEQQLYIKGSDFEQRLQFFNQMYPPWEWNDFEMGSIPKKIILDVT